MTIAVSTISTLNDLAVDVLTVSEAALAETTAGVPDRTYVSAAEPAFDCCPFLSVHVPALTEEATGAGPGGAASGHRTMRGSIILATYVVLAVRCSPTIEGGQLPSLQALEEVASQVQQDGWALWNELRAAVRDDRIFGLCSEVHFDGGASIPDQGGCVGWRFTIRAAIPGIPYTPSS